MLDLTKLTEDELNLLKTITQKIASNSRLDRLQIFTMNPVERAEIIVYIYNILNNVNEIIKQGSGKNQIEKEIELLKNDIEKLKLLLLEYENPTNFGKNRLSFNIEKIVNNKEMYRLINLMSVLNERLNLIDIAKFKGVILEGQSEEEFKRVFGENEIENKEEDVSPFITNDDFIKQI